MKRQSKSGVNVERHEMIDVMLASLNDPEVTGEINVGWRKMVIKAFHIVDRGTSPYWDKTGNLRSAPDVDALHDIRDRLLYHWIQTVALAGREQHKGVFFINRISNDPLIPNSVNDPDPNDGTGCNLQ